jgi:hypothetical protein
MPPHVNHQNEDYTFIWVEFCDYLPHTVMMLWIIVIRKPFYGLCHTLLGYSWVLLFPLLHKSPAFSFWFWHQSAGKEFVFFKMQNSLNLSQHHWFNYLLLLVFSICLPCLSFPLIKFFILFINSNNEYANTSWSTSHIMALLLPKFFRNYFVYSNPQYLNENLYLFCMLTHVICPNKEDDSDAQ